MSKPSSLSTILKIDQIIHTVRDQRVILDSDLARIYGVPTKALNQAVKRNAGRFPADFAFQLTPSEVAGFLRSQIVTSKGTANRSQFVTGSQKHRDPKYRPYAFTEHGALMAANLLRSHLGGPGIGGIDPVPGWLYFRELQQERLRKKERGDWPVAGRPATRWRSWIYGLETFNFNILNFDRPRVSLPPCLFYQVPERLQTSLIHHPCRRCRLW